MKTEQSFRFALQRQFNEKWRMLNDAIINVPEDKWHEGKDEWIFSWIVYHIIETANFYSQNHPDNMKWGEHVQIDWKKDSKEIISEKKKILTKELIQNYLIEIKNNISKYLETTTDEELLKTDGFHWFNTIYEKLVYLLRHNSYHLGELANMLREWDSERIKW